MGSTTRDAPVPCSSPWRLGADESGKTTAIGSVDTLWWSSLIFVAAAGGVWVSGARLSEYVDLLAGRWNLGRALAGALLLGGATSLPEMATTLTAAGSGATALATGNLLGGVVVQMAVLAGVDAVLVRDRPLTSFAPTVAVLVQGVFLVLMAGLAGAAITAGEIVSLAGVGLWPAVLAGVFVVGLRVVHSVEADPRWRPIGDLVREPELEQRIRRDLDERHGSLTTGALVARFGVAATGVLLAGSAVALSGERIAETTGVDQSFVGASAVSVATSLPEITTTVAAVRIGAHSMAIANILGSNALMLALFLPADLVDRDGPIIDSMEPSSAFLACLAVILTARYLWGAVERRDRTLFGVGWDSVAVLVGTVVGLGLFAAS